MIESDGRFAAPRGGVPSDPPPPQRSRARARKPAARPDAVRVSVRDPQFVRLLVNASPDVRSERVQELRLRLHTGAYDFDPGRVAEGIIRNRLKPRD